MGPVAPLHVVLRLGAKSVVIEVVEVAGVGGNRVADFAAKELIGRFAAGFAHQIPERDVDRADAE